MPVLPAVLSACQRSPRVIEANGATMGTTYSIVAVDHDNTLDRAAIEAAIEETLAEVNAQLSNWDAGSEVSRFNAAATTEPLPVSPAIRDVMVTADIVHRASGGQFDVTLGPLIDAWGFGAASAAPRTPTDAEISAALAAAGQSGMTIGDGTLAKPAPETEIFLSAIGKGYGVDRVAAALAARGVTDYMVEIGGDLVTAGRNPDGVPWQIGVETPDAFTGGLQAVAAVSGLGMATSGDYRNYFEEDGVRYSHILDAQTGRPITHTTASATVLTDSAMAADAWATAMLVLGEDRGLPIAEAEGLAVLFVSRAPGGATPRFVTRASSHFAALQA
ncbi:MAG: FAD:protein FMN transferase [Pseudomonadota bacterium]